MYPVQGNNHREGLVPTTRKTSFVVQGNGNPEQRTLDSGRNRRRQVGIDGRVSNPNDTMITIVEYVEASDGLQETE